MPGRSGDAGARPAIGANLGKWQSGQMHLTVNQAPKGFVGSNPTFPTNIAEGKAEVVWSVS